ncbi:MAG: hypothetical protein ABIO37_10590, partial [Caulobacteraceae bacterium]
MNLLALRRSPTFLTLAVFLAAYALCVARFPVVLSGRVLGDLLTDSAVLGIAAVGMTVVIVSGGIDLSVGGVMAFSSVFVAVAITHWGLPPIAAFAAILVLAAGFGAGVGAAIHGLKTPPFIVTLAAMFLSRGGCFVLSKQSTPIHDATYDRLSSAAIALPGGFTLSLVAMMMLATFIA